MNRNHLALFRAVAAHGSVTRAAAALRISQPAVSSQVARLERQLGAQLFDRLPRGVRLTQVGEVLFTYARRIGQLEEEARAAVADHLGLRQGRLSVGASTSIGSYLLPEVLGELSRRFPGLQLSLVISNTESIQQDLLDGSLDLGLTEGFADRDLFDITIFRQDRLVLIAPPDHLLVAEAAVSLHRVLDFPLLAREPGSGTRAVIEREFAKRDLEFRPAMSLGSSEALKRAVASGLGLALISELAVRLELEHGLLATVGVEDLEIRRPLHLLRPLGRTAPAPARAFADLLRQLEV